MIIGKSMAIRGFLSLMLLAGVWAETGWFTTIAIALGIAANEVQAFMWRQLIEARDRDAWAERIRRLS